MNKNNKSEQKPSWLEGLKDTQITEQAIQLHVGTNFKAF